MFAVVEFMNANGASAQELSVVPLIWLCKNDTKCYWPQRIQKPFIEFVKQQTPYKTSWPKYKVFKVHFKTESYQQAEKNLATLLDSEISAMSNESTASFTQKKIADDQDESSSNSEEETPPHKIPKTKEPSRIIESSFATPVAPSCSMSFINNQDHQRKLQINGKKGELNSERPFDSSSPMIFNNDDQQSKSHNTSFSSVPSTVTDVVSNSDVSAINDSFQQKVLNVLCKMHTEIEQHSLILNELAHNSRIQTDKPPENLPNFPVRNLEEFNALDALIKNHKNVAKFLVKRLSAVGGSGVESLTRRILKYLLSNEVAVLFNWKGRDKIPFEKTQLMAVIYEAAKRNFCENEKNDYIIAKTVKDWLKYSRARLSTSTKKKN